ncbi:unnamed protein product [Cuscuta campestris]|uniref:Uncharacterized protein n=1 Tax=Cuscuta campestris TaxID=132261 RepID=A0A484KVB5_9ASTE|nr:unnamed protein product [Cuscuta campestris]
MLWGFTHRRDGPFLPGHGVTATTNGWHLIAIMGVAHLVLLRLPASQWMSNRKNRGDLSWMGGGRSLLAWPSLESSVLLIRSLSQLI